MNGALEKHRAYFSVQTIQTNPEVIEETTMLNWDDPLAGLNGSNPRKSHIPSDLTDQAIPAL